MQVVSGWISVFLTGASLIYSHSLLEQAAWGTSSTRIANDIIGIAYVTPILAIVFALQVLWLGGDGEFPRSLGGSILAGSVLSLCIWVGLHLSGTVYSYSGIAKYAG